MLICFIIICHYIHFYIYVKKNLIMNKKLAIIGAGGHGKVVGKIALLNNYNSIYFFDDNFSNIENYPFKILNDLAYLNNHLGDYDDYFVAIVNKDKEEI